MKALKSTTASKSLKLILAVKSMISQLSEDPAVARVMHSTLSKNYAG